MRNRDSDVSVRKPVQFVRDGCPDLLERRFVTNVRGRGDRLSVDDLGIQEAMTHIYKLDPADKKTMKEKMISIAEKWRPYRTYACKYLWRWKDGMK
ncbi:MAG: hypothetical protein EOP06_30860 [Proteobacteria bacterium]|nr:MAG: hypothetical protein EOP06_30860 [Pseudomonadota bacterium]